MNILVTGCAGFIGWRVSQLLLDQGHLVIGLDDLNDAYDVRLKSWRLAQLGHSGFAFLQADITAHDVLTQAVEQAGMDAVIHLAARTGIRRDGVDPRAWADTNVKGTINVLELCLTRRIPKLILASDATLYGAHSAVPFREDANTDRPASPYAASKKAAETVCYTYHYLHNLDVTVLRYSTAYGPGGRPDMSLFRFVQWISEGRPVTVYGDGKQRRDFTYVDDIAQGTIAALRPLGYEVINLGSNEPVSVNEAIALIESLVGQQAQIEFQPRHSADIPATWADIGKAERLLGWRPAQHFREGLGQLVSWYRENRAWAKDIVTA